MAEGDTIHRLARRIGDQMGGEPIEAAEAPSPRSPLHRSAQRLAGRRLDGAAAKGKHLLLSLDDGTVIRSHLRMSGAWHLYARGERWRKPRRMAWLALATPDTEAVMFGGSELELLRSAALARHRRLARLGPDILGPAFTTEIGVASLRRRCADQSLGEALLDQGAIAGVGNVFKSEGCFEAKLDPWRRVGELDEAKLSSVIGETAALMSDALERGSRVRRVYGRAGRPCPRCGAQIRSRGQGDENRTTYWCPACQA
jgi:endonuclease-8